MEDNRIVLFPDRRASLAPATPFGDVAPVRLHPAAVATETRSPREAVPGPDTLISTFETPPAAAGASASWADRLFGADVKQRIRLMRCATAFALAAACVGNMAFLAWAGLADGRAVQWWALGLLGGSACFLMAIRSGVNRRFADPSLALPQMVHAIVFGAIAYALAGAGRGGAFPVLMVIFMFGMFSLPPSHVRGAATFTVMLFGGTMAWMAHRDPSVYDPVVEWGHFMMVAVMVPAISLLAGHLSRLRARLRRQKKDIALALARIQDLATRDELTGLVNRRHMVDLIEQERQRGVRSGQPFCVAVIELDDLSRTPAGLSAEAHGELLLRRFAQEAQQQVRISDRLGRWDGGRFLLLLANTHGSLARLGLDRLQATVCGVPVDAEALESHLGFSAGVVEHRAGEATHATIARAEEALRFAIDAGRHRTAVA